MIKTRQARSIREGMNMGAVWLAWGSPEQKGYGRMRGRSTETWIYRAYYNRIRSGTCGGAMAMGILTMAWAEAEFWSVGAMGIGVSLPPTIRFTIRFSIRASASAAIRTKRSLSKTGAP